MNPKDVFDGHLLSDWRSVVQIPSSIFYCYATHNCTQTHSFTRHYSLQAKYWHNSFYFK